MEKISYIAKRLLLMIPVLFVVSVLIFFMIRLIPGDPITLMLGDKATPEIVAAKKAELGLDKSLLTQYWIFLKKLVVLDFGKSIMFKVSVADLIQKRLGVTVMLTAAAAVFMALISLPLGYISGIKKDRWPDQLTRIFSLFAISMPEFLIGMLLIILFGLKLKWFPASGGWGDTLPEHIRAVILPGLTLSLSTSALLIRNLRNSVVNVAKSDYVDFARSKGVSERIVKNRHIIRNALVSTVTLFTLRIAYLLGGSIVVEQVFNLKGVGSLLIQSILSRDYVVVQGVVFIFALMIMTVFLITDVLYSFLDPRVSLD